MFTRRTLIIVGALIILAAGIGIAASQAITPPPPTPTPDTQLRLSARGRIAPARQARVGTLYGGVVNRLAPEVGTEVDEQDEVARVRGPNGTEVLTAPFPGTITGQLVNLGDTVLPGATLVTVGSLSHLRVETTDVDEFLIAQIWPGQRVQVRVDALDRRQLGGIVQSVSLEPQRTTTGDQHYPVVVELDGQFADLRSGMTVRLEFSGER